MAEEAEKSGRIEIISGEPFDLAFNGEGELEAEY